MVFCGEELNCWVAWIWSSQTASWVQAISSIFAIFFTIRLWRQDKRHRDNAILEMTNKRIAAVKVTMSMLSSYLRKTIEYSKDNPTKQVNSILDVTIRVCKTCRDDLLEFPVGDIPNLGLLMHTRVSAAMIEEIIEYINHLSRIPPISLTGRISGDDYIVLAGEQVNNFIKEINLRQDVIQDFHERYEVDINATWNKE